MNKQRIGFIITIVVLIVLRLSLTSVIVAQPDRALWPDSDSYLQLTESLLSGQHFRGEDGSSVDLQRTPGYPFFLASVFAVFGPESYPEVVFLQLAFGGLIAFVLYTLGKQYFSGNVGIMAAILYLITPNAVLWSMAILTDIPFALLLAFSSLPAAAYYCDPKPRHAALAGALLGISALIRPIALLVALLWGVLILVHGLFSLKSWRKAAYHTGVFVLAAGLFIGGWMLRNHLVWGQATLSSISTWNLGHYMAPAALARAQGISLEAARELIPTTRIPQPGERERYLQILLDHPIDFMITHLQGTRIIFTEAGRPTYAKFLGVTSIASGVVGALKDLDIQAAFRQFLSAFSDPALRFVYPALAYSLVFQMFTYVFSLVGVVRLVLKRQGFAFWMALTLLLTISLLLFSPGVVGNSRFRVPAEPFLAILTAIGVAPCLKRQEESCSAAEEGK